MLLFSVPLPNGTVPHLTEVAERDRGERKKKGKVNPRRVEFCRPFHIQTKKESCDSRTVNVSPGYQVSKGSKWSVVSFLLYLNTWRRMVFL